jgi:hypothetical protein
MIFGVFEVIVKDNQIMIIHMRKGRGLAVGQTAAHPGPKGSK